MGTLAVGVDMGERVVKVGFLVEVKEAARLLAGTVHVVAVVVTVVVLGPAGLGRPS